MRDTYYDTIKATYLATFRHFAAMQRKYTQNQSLQKRYPEHT
jgi:hypothetical protein